MAQDNIWVAAGCRLDDLEVARAAETSDIPRFEARPSLDDRKVERRSNCVQASTVRPAETAA